MKPLRHVLCTSGVNDLPSGIAESYQLMGIPMMLPAASSYVIEPLGLLWAVFSLYQ